MRLDDLVSLLERQIHQPINSCVEIPIMVIPSILSFHLSGDRFKTITKQIFEHDIYPSSKYTIVAGQSVAEGIDDDVSIGVGDHRKSICGELGIDTILQINSRSGETVGINVEKDLIDLAVINLSAISVTNAISIESYSRSEHVAILVKGRNKNRGFGIISIERDRLNFCCHDVRSPFKFWD